MNSLKQLSIIIPWIKAFLGSYEDLSEVSERDILKDGPFLSAKFKLITGVPEELLEGLANFSLIAIEVGIDYLDHLQEGGFVDMMLDFRQIGEYL